MPGLSSGLTPKIITFHRDDPSVFDREFVPTAKFPTVHTLIDTFVIMQTAMTTNTSTTHIRVVLQDGATTGSGTTAVGSVISSAWVAYTGKTMATNYTFAANDWLRHAWSEAGTADGSQSAAIFHLVEGNV